MHHFGAANLEQGLVKDCRPMRHAAVLGLAMEIMEEYLHTGREVILVYSLSKIILNILGVMAFTTI